MNKIISLDFWGTIAVFNPAYAAARTRYLADLFGLPEDEAHARYQFVKRSCDHNAEHSGAAVTPLLAIKTLLGDTILSGERNAVTVLADFEQLVRDNPPLLHPEIPDLLAEMRDEGFIVGVASNTNFIAGALVQSIFKLPWAFTVYSDELGVSKPDSAFFETVIKRASECAGLDYPSAHIDMLHIGDNSVCDVDGAIQAGIKGRLVKSPDETVGLLRAMVDGLVTAFA